MALWAIYASDNLYCGAYGMNDFAIIDGTEEEANECGRDLSIGIINMYSTIYNELEETVKEICEDDKTADEDSVREDIYNEDISYNCIELDPDKLPTSDIKELEEMYYNMYCNNTEEFIEKYTKQISI